MNFSPESMAYRGFSMNENISFKLNGEAVSVNTDAQRPLLWVLRTNLGLTGTKYGCGKGLCGVCTVIIDGRALRSCMISVGSVKDKEILTIEGLANDGELHPIQKAFVKHDALQCGFCTPGMIMNAYALLAQNADPTEEQIRSGMEDNLCRCGAHIRIIDAIQGAARVLVRSTMSWVAIS